MPAAWGRLRAAPYCRHWGLTLRFETTNWSNVLRAGAEDPAAAQPALAALCESYWPPVYAFIRRKGYSPDDARDLTQGYFARFLEKRYARDVSPQAGRFRSFLCASVQHFLSNERHRERAEKRGGKLVLSSLETARAEGRWLQEPTDQLTPEEVFERQWAASVVERCLERLRAEQSRRSRDRYERLKPCLVSEMPTGGYAALASDLGISENALRVAVHRLRKRFGALLREEVGRTLPEKDDVDAEIRWLLERLRRP